MQGVGDLIELFTKITGIKSIVKWVSSLLKKDCGCDARKEKINVILPFKNNGTRENG